MLETLIAEAPRFFGYYNMVFLGSAFLMTLGLSIVGCGVGFAAGFVLSFVVVGLLIIIPLYVIGIVFPIIGAIKAAQGELWNYPLTIRFLK